MSPSTPEWDFGLDETVELSVHKEPPDHLPSTQMPLRLAQLFRLRLDENTALATTPSPYDDFFYAISMLPLPSPAPEREWWRRWIPGLRDGAHASPTAAPPLLSPSPGALLDSAGHSPHSLYDAPVGLQSGGPSPVLRDFTISPSGYPPVTGGFRTASGRSSGGSARSSREASGTDFPAQTVSSASVPEADPVRFPTPVRDQTDNPRPHSPSSAVANNPGTSPRALASLTSYPSTQSSTALPIIDVDERVREGGREPEEDDADRDLEAGPSMPSSTDTVSPPV